MSETSNPETTVSLRHLSEEEYPILLRLSEQLRRIVDLVGRFGS